MVEHENEDLRGSTFRNVNLSGSRLRGVILHNVKITDAWLDNVDISAEVVSLKVNGIEVADFVRDEMEKRHPELRMIQATDPDGMRAAWAMIQETADATVQRARSLPASALEESVDGEWSYLQTLRHLVFATDRWITGPVQGESSWFHPLGYPYDGASDDEIAPLDLDAKPSLDEILGVRADRMARVTGILRDATDEDLQRTVKSPDGGTTTVGDCARVVMIEEWWHNSYANRDLDVLTSPS